MPNNIVSTGVLSHHLDGGFRDECLVVSTKEAMYTNESPQKRLKTKPYLFKQILPKKSWFIYQAKQTPHLFFNDKALVKTLYT